MLCLDVRFLVEVEWRLSLVRFRVCSLSRLIGNCWMVNLRPGGALRWKVEDHWLRRSGSVMWKVGTSKVVVLDCVS
jgi:hypothetical protein